MSATPPEIEAVAAPVTRRKRTSADAPVRLSVPATPEMHQAFAIQCVDLEIGMGNRVIQLVQHDMAGKIELEFTAKQPNKSETHTKSIPANLPKPLHKEFRKYCLRNGYLMTDHVERLILWDLQNKGEALPPVDD